MSRREMLGDKHSGWGEGSHPGRSSRAYQRRRNYQIGSWRMVGLWVFNGKGENSEFMFIAFLEDGDGAMGERVSRDVFDG